MADVVDDIDGLAVVVPLLLAPGFHVHVDIRRRSTGRESSRPARSVPIHG